MSKTTQLNDLRELCFFLLKRSNEVHARAEAMLVLLEKHDVFSTAEFQPLYEQLAKAANQRAEQLIGRLKSAENAAAIHQLLKDYKGTIQ